MVEEYTAVEAAVAALQSIQGGPKSGACTDSKP